MPASLSVDSVCLQNVVGALKQAQGEGRGTVVALLLQCCTTSLPTNTQDITMCLWYLYDNSELQDGGYGAIIQKLPQV